MSRSNRKALLAALAPVALALSFGVGSASADTYDFTLNVSNLASPPYTGPYVAVDVNRTSPTTATITFTSLTNGGYIYLMGDGSSAAVNVNATSWTLGAITGSNSQTGFTPGPYSNGGSGNADGFGSFNQAINSFDGFTHSSTQISFGLTDTSGTWASAANVLTPNAAGNIAAAHIFACATACNAANGAAATGFASVVPIPAAAWLFGSGLIGLIGIARRKLAA